MQIIDEEHLYPIILHAPVGICILNAETLNIEGYDLDKNGTGDVPYRPISMYAQIIEQNPYSRKEQFLAIQAPILRCRFRPA